MRLPIDRAVGSHASETVERQTFERLRENVHMQGFRNPEE